MRSKQSFRSSLSAPSKFLDNVLPDYSDEGLERESRFLGSVRNATEPQWFRGREQGMGRNRKYCNPASILLGGEEIGALRYELSSCRMIALEEKEL
jgi:hypothetical protein